MRRSTTRQPLPADLVADLAARLHYSLVTLAALAFVWWLNYWNLLGYRL